MVTLLPGSFLETVFMSIEVKKGIENQEIRGRENNEDGRERGWGRKEMEEKEGWFVSLHRSETRT